MHCTNKYSQHSSIIWPLWLNGSLFVCFSEYPDNLRFYDVTNKKVIGKMKNKTKGAPMLFLLD